MARQTGSLIGCIALAIVSVGCAATPRPLQGDFFAPITPDEAALEHRTGAYVRWGGQILSTSHDENETCFDVLSRPLDSRAKPERTDAMEGRYRACAPGFYDPAVYEEGRAITTTGVVVREATQHFDSFELQMPVVRADVVYLWPRRIHYGSPYPFYPYYGWGWGGAPYFAYGSRWGPYWGPWWGARWGAPWAPYPAYGGFGYRRSYRYGHHGGRQRGPTRAARMAPAGRGGHLGGGGGSRVPVGGR